MAQRAEQEETAGETLQGEEEAWNILWGEESPPKPSSEDEPMPQAPALPTAAESRPARRRRCEECVNCFQPK